MRDQRDPKILGEQLLRALSENTPSMGPAARLLSWTYDYNRAFFQKVPDWTGDGFMSTNPANHHSKVDQSEGDLTA